MTSSDPPWLRPLLGLRRAETAAACRGAACRLDDPHNVDPRFTRVRLRHEVLPLLEEVLGGGVAEALARTAAQLRDDDGRSTPPPATCSSRAYRNAEDTVQERGNWARTGNAQFGCRNAKTSRCRKRRGRRHADVLGAAPAAVRRRALRSWLTTHGVTGLTDLHLRAADDLVGRWRGQGAVALPQRLELVRERGRLRVRTAAWPGAR